MKQTLDNLKLELDFFPLKMSLNNLKFKTNLILFYPYMVISILNLKKKSYYHLKLALISI